MTSTGIFGSGGIVQFGPDLYGTDDDPMDTVIMRDGVLHGTMHACDSMAQVRVNYMPIGESISQDQDSFETIEPGGTADTWYELGGSPMGVWPITLRADGSAYLLRVRIAAALSATAATAKIRVIIAPARALSRLEVAENLDSIVQATFTSATVAWIASPNVASQGSLNKATYATVSAAQVREWTRDVSIYDGTSSTVLNTAQQCLVAAHVWATTTDITKLPRLHGLHIEESIG